MSESAIPQLRPLGIGEILDVGIKITIRHWWTLARAVLVVVVPLQLLAAIVDVSASGGIVTSNGGTTIDEDELSTFIGAAFVAVALTLLAQTIATGACFKAVTDAYLGRVPSWRRSLAEVFRRLHSIIWVSILAFLLAILGFVACIAPGVWLYISWTVAVPVLLTEGAKGRRALGRSFRLVKGFWWRTFAIVLVGSILGGIIEAALSGVLQGIAFATDSDVVDVVTSTFSAVAAGCITTPFVAAVTIALYIDLRVRKEGFDLALLVSRFGEPGDDTETALVPPAPPPYVPRPLPPSGGTSPPYWPPPPGWKPGTDE